MIICNIKRENFPQLCSQIYKLTGKLPSLSTGCLRLTPRGVDGGGITVSSKVVLLPSIVEAAKMLGSSMIVWSEKGNHITNCENTAL